PINFSRKGPFAVNSKCVPSNNIRQRRQGINSFVFIIYRLIVYVGLPFQMGLYSQGMGSQTEYQVLIVFVENRVTYKYPENIQTKPRFYIGAFFKGIVPPMNILFQHPFVTPIKIKILPVESPSFEKSPHQISIRPVAPTF